MRGFGRVLRHAIHKRPGGKGHHRPVAVGQVGFRSLAFRQGFAEQITQRLLGDRSQLPGAPDGSGTGARSSSEMTNAQGKGKSALECPSPRQGGGWHNGQSPGATGERINTAERIRCLDQHGPSSQRRVRGGKTGFEQQVERRTGPSSSMPGLRNLRNADHCRDPEGSGTPRAEFWERVGLLQSSRHRTGEAGSARVGCRSNTYSPAARGEQPHKRS